MNSKVIFSVIIPHRNSIETLPRLFDSIPDRDDVEIIVVDNSPVKIKPITCKRNVTLLYSEPERGAGGARNVGIDYSHGEWLLFADADDFYTPDAFDTFFSHITDDVDIVYSEMGGMYEETKLPAKRGERYVKLVKDYLCNRISEDVLRTQFHSPCCKMIRRALVMKFNLRFSEVIAGNDAFFSMATGLFANKILAIDTITYIATVSSGSLTQRKDQDAFFSRYSEDLKINQFLKSHGKSKLQYKVLGTIYRSKQYGFCAIFKCLWMALKCKQNIFVGL